MFTTKPKTSTPYAPLAVSSEDEPLTLESKDSLEHDAESASTPTLNNSSDDLPLKPTPAEKQSLFLPKLLLYSSLLLALLSAVNVALLPATLSQYLAYPLSEQELEALPYPETRLGLDRAAKMMPPPQVYWRSWPEKIARVSRKLKNAVYGDGVQVYITVEDSTIMRFPVPQTGVNACALNWLPPPQFSGRNKDLETKGDISEIEVWSLIAPSATSSDIDQLDYDNISFNTLPIQGELLGTLDLTKRPNATTVEFACPQESESLVVELRCQRVACHVAFMQIEMAPKFGFELVRRKE